MEKLIYSLLINQYIHYGLHKQHFYDGDLIYLGDETEHVGSAQGLHHEKKE